MEKLQAEKNDSERKELEEQGKIKELLDKEIAERDRLKAELDSIKSGYEREKTQTALDRALEREGIGNAYTRRGILDEYFGLEEKPSVDEFVASVKETTPDLFAAQQPTGVSVRNAPVGAAASRGRMTDDAIDAGLRDSDPKVRAEAWQALKAQVASNS